MDGRGTNTPKYMHTSYRWYFNDILLFLFTHYYFFKHEFPNYNIMNISKYNLTIELTV